LKPEIHWRLDADPLVELPQILFMLLEAIESDGTLSAAARRCGISYRSAWNLMNEWSDRLGAPIIRSRRGQGAVLSLLGAKLLWANRHTREQTYGMLHAIGQRVSRELEGLIAVRANDSLSIHASHCLSHDILRRLVAERYTADFSINHGGSARCLSHLANGECVVAGFHLADGDLGKAFIERYRNAIEPSQCHLMLAAKRRQGLIVKAGNPCNIGGVDDLMRGDIRFVNRQANSGTRILLDLLLQKRGIDIKAIRGFDNIEFTHSAVSAMVAGDSVDVSIGNESAAVAFNLDFIPLASESYFYAVLSANREHPGVIALRQILASPAWKDEVSKLDGLNVDGAGRVLKATELFGEN
jgi:molybdate transport repressor ModE-like protein